MSTESLSKKFKGHLGRLTPEQETALSTFKANLEKAKLYSPATETSKASHDDETLLRFLRARRFDPEKAQKQFSDTLAWRKKYDVDNLFANFDTEEFEASRRYYPRWTGRRDRDGLPLYVYRIASLSNGIQSEITAVSPKRRYERIIALYEVMMRFVSPFCTYLPHAIAPTPVSAVTSIIDLGDSSLRQLWALRSHLQEASELATANYPETLGTVVIINCPSFFPTIWGWVKGWFDEVTREKIHVLGKDAGDVMRKLINPADLPKAYGGELEWTFLDEPSLDDEAKKVIGEMPKGSFIFEDGVVKRPKEYVEPQAKTEPPPVDK